MNKAKYLSIPPLDDKILVIDTQTNTLMKTITVKKAMLAYNST